MKNKNWGHSARNIYRQNSWTKGESYIDLGQEIEEITREINDLWRQKLPKNNHYTQAEIESIHQKIAYLEQRLLQKMDENLHLRCEIEKDINQLPIKERRLFRLRYLEGLSWQNIAYQINYNVDHCRRLHRQILQQIQK